MSLFDSAWVIARRDFLALVFSRFFIIFLLAPLLLFGFSIFFSMATRAQDRAATQPVVAMIVDGPTADALAHSRQRLAANTSEQTFPTAVVAPAENVRLRAQNLLAARRVIIGGAERHAGAAGPDRAGISAFVSAGCSAVDESRAPRARPARGASRLAAPARGDRAGGR